MRDGSVKVYALYVLSRHRPPSLLGDNRDIYGHPRVLVIRIPLVGQILFSLSDQVVM